MYLHPGSFPQLWIWRSDHCPDASPRSFQTSISKIEGNIPFPVSFVHLPALSLREWQPGPLLLQATALHAHLLSLLPLQVQLSPTPVTYLQRRGKPHAMMWHPASHTSVDLVTSSTHSVCKYLLNVSEYRVLPKEMKCVSVSLILNGFKHLHINHI